MKKTFLLFIIVLCSIALFAQNEDWLWAKQAGGTDYDEGKSIAVDVNGNSYVTGYFAQSATFGANILTSIGEVDIFVAKLDRNGNWLWAKQAVGSGVVHGYGIAVDANGNSYVTGGFSGSATFGTTTLTSSSWGDIFVAKLDSNGNWLWAKQAVGSGFVHGYGIAADANGNSYVIGSFYGSVSFGNIPLLSNVENIFVAKLNSNGNWLWVKQAGGTIDVLGGSIAVDANGNSYVTGRFSGNVSFGTIPLISNVENMFVAKLNSSGNWLWAKQAGCSDCDICYGNDIAVDANGNSYVTGFFVGNANFGTTTLTSSGNYDIFVAKLNSNGNWLWAKQAGGTDIDFGNSIAVNANGNSYVTGNFSSRYATFGTTTLNGDMYGRSYIFVAKIDNNGNWFWAKQAGGTGLDYVKSIAIDTNGNSYVTGWFYDNATFGATTLTGSGDYDIFVAKLGEGNSISLPDIISFNGIHSIYPNPFNPLTTIDYEISMPADVKIEVYNNRGQLVRSFALGYKEQGSYKLTWEGEDNNGCLCSTGIYYIRMQAGKEIYTKKAVLLK
ncbi:MAG: SBBP repeat-containing protein [Candidatus Cloacimonas sp.]